LSERVTIVAGRADDAALETFLGALARALRGCRFAIATRDGSALLALLGDRFQVWPVGESLPALAASVRRSDGLVFLDEPRGLRALARAAALATLAGSSDVPAFLLATAGAGSSTPRWLADAFRARVESLPCGADGAREIARRLGSTAPPRAGRPTAQEPPPSTSTSAP
jgi:hypothetical protein